MNEMRCLASVFYRIFWGLFSSFESFTTVKTNDSNYILRGPPVSFQKELEETSVDEYIISAAKRRSNVIYMIDAETNETLTRRDFLDKSYKLAAALQELGCYKDTIVGILAENRLEYPIITLGTMLTGASITCFDSRHTVDELKFVINITNPTIIFCSIGNCDKIERVPSASTRVIIGLDSIQSANTDAADDQYLEFSQLIQSTKTLSKVKNRPDDIALILHSSGTTTGLPKAVMLTHKNILFVLKLLEENLVENNGSMVVCLTRMFHISGMNTLLSAVVRNETLVIARNHNEKLFLFAIQKYEIRRLLMTPILITFLLKSPLVDEYDLSSLEFISCGAGPIKPETEEALKKKLHLKYVQQIYGMTESTMYTAVKNPVNPKAGTCGTVVPGIQMKIVHLQTGAILGKNEAGEIYIKGPSIMKGYFGNEDATAETIDTEGWLRSGDIGFYDNEGDIFIVGRVKELIKCEGAQVPPAELEAHLLEHPLIADAAVIGIPDEERGEIPRAYIVKRDGAHITEAEILQFIEGKVLPQKRLQGGVEFVSRIPKNTSGKILRKELRERWDTNNEHKP